MKERQTMRSKTIKSGVNIYGSRAVIGEANAVMPIQRITSGEENMHTDDRLR